jgi:hypothetical protein
MMVRRRESVAETEDASLRDWATALRLNSSYPDQALGCDVYYRVRRVPLGLMLMIERLVTEPGPGFFHKCRAGRL